MFIKVCGITRHEDARCAIDGGATALGFVFWSRSPRSVTAEQVRDIISRLPAGVTTVGVFVDESEETIRRTIELSGIGAVQLYGEAEPAAAARLGRPVFKAMTLTTASHTAAQWPDDVTLLLDAHDPVRRGGTGRQIDWSLAAAAAARRPVFLSGGLAPDNIGEAIDRVRPYGVDLSSGVEASPGIKDPVRLRALFRAVAAAHALVDDSPAHG